MYFLISVDYQTKYKWYNVNKIPKNQGVVGDDTSDIQLYEFENSNNSFHCIKYTCRAQTQI